jgi:hypothetical protein
MLAQTNYQQLVSLSIYTTNSQCKNSYASGIILPPHFAKNIFFIVHRHISLDRSMAKKTLPVHFEQDDAILFLQWVQNMPEYTHHMESLTIHRLECDMNDDDPLTAQSRPTTDIVSSMSLYNMLHFWYNMLCGAVLCGINTIYVNVNGFRQMY